MDIKPSSNASYNSIAIIGGSGFYDFLEEPSKISVTTPFSSKPVIIYRQDHEGKFLYFLPRHGGNHTIPPHKINFKANIFALHSLSIPRVIATSAVGSLHPSIRPGDYVLLDQFIDLVRPVTFFDGDFSVTFTQGTKISGVVHLDMTEPYCPEIRNILSVILKSDLSTHNKGTYATTMGPRFETPAEIKAFQHMGADVVGMTNSSEAILCRELGICYGVIAVVTNMAAGLQKQVNHEEVITIFETRSANLKLIFHKVIANLPMHKSCSCAWYIEK
ncbi:MAG: MTAP family purine nucleoside phosphorylase [Candidatus Heimdallarchaeota archaeon]|nr:MAG: MTAP family purine nucleoside phosphorylase [Candidatus Heimdallarchaeota archaeon]